MPWQGWVTLGLSDRLRLQAPAGTFKPSLVSGKPLFRTYCPSVPMQRLWTSRYYRSLLSRCRLPRADERSSKPMAVRFLQMTHAAEACMSRCTSGNSQWDASPRWATVGHSPMPLSAPCRQTPAPQFHLKRSHRHLDRVAEVLGRSLEEMVARYRYLQLSAAFSLPMKPRHCCHCWSLEALAFQPRQPGHGSLVSFLVADIRE